MILHTSRTFFSFFPPSEARPSETPPALPTSGASRTSIMLTAAETARKGVKSFLATPHCITIQLAFDHRLMNGRRI